ncbi:12237_t:CDS:1, partial [Ambispora leptoticha]
MFEIGALKQGAHESASSYLAKILKYGDQLGYTPAQKKTQFMSGVRDDIKEEIYRIGQHRAINNILDSLAELELRCGVLGLPPSYYNYIPAPPIIPNN